MKSLLVITLNACLSFWLDSSTALMSAYVAESATNFMYRTDFPTPVYGNLEKIFMDKEIKNGCEVLLEVYASSVNPADRSSDQYRLPKALGSDVGGKVIQVGDTCTRIKINDLVF